MKTPARKTIIPRLFVGLGALLLVAPGSQSFAQKSAGEATQAASPLQGLAFVRGQSIQNRHVMKTRIDGSVTRLVRGFDPVWSPTGRELAYLALRPVAPSAGMESDIFVVSADGRQRRRITNDPRRSGTFSGRRMERRSPTPTATRKAGDATSSSPTAAAVSTDGSHGQSPCANRQGPRQGRRTSRGRYWTRTNIRRKKASRNLTVLNHPALPSWAASSSRLGTSWFEDGAARLRRAFGNLA